MSAEAWETFRCQVLADPALHAGLLAASGGVEFTTAVVQLAAARGLPVSAEDVDHALVEARS